MTGRPTVRLIALLRLLDTRRRLDAQMYRLRLPVIERQYRQMRATAP